MKTKKILTLATAALLSLASCDSKLDIVPLGMTTLETVDDLETLLNQNPMLYLDEDMMPYEILCNNMYLKYDGLPDYFGNHYSLVYAWFAYDETVDRTDLTAEDGVYNSLYESINYMNVIISKAPDASGDDAKRRQIIAEAKVLRAWYHFLLVNMYAKQYDEATAAETGGTLMWTTPT